MKYEPKTLQVQRDGIKQFFAATKSGGAAWWTDSVAADVVDDLAHCEQCLAEREAEVERLKWRPIKTAPKRTDVLCLLESGKSSVLYLTDNGDVLISTWRNLDGTASGCWPTHWMPLPQPPQQEPNP